MKKLSKFDEKLKETEKKVYPEVFKMFKNKFGEKTTKNLFIGMVSGSIVSLYLILLEIFKEIFKIFNLNNYIIFIDIIFLLIFVVIIRKFSNFFLSK